MQPDVVIMSTCADRPELHTQAFNSYKSYLNGINCKWIITINNIQNQVEDTEKNLRFILEDYDLHIKTFSTGGTGPYSDQATKFTVDEIKELI